jgi:hypothetical protein
MHAENSGRSLLLPILAELHVSNVEPYYTVSVQLYAVERYSLSSLVCTRTVQLWPNTVWNFLLRTAVLVLVYSCMYDVHRDLGGVQSVHPEIQPGRTCTTVVQ